MRATIYRPDLFHIARRRLPLLLAALLLVLGAADAAYAAPPAAGVSPAGGVKNDGVRTVYTWAGGNYSDTTFPTTIPSGDELDITGMATHWLDVNLTNQGMTVVENNAVVLTPGDQNFDNQGTFDVQTDAGSFGWNASGSLGVFTNSGVIRKSQGSGEFDFTMPIHNTGSGQIDTQTGMIGIDVGGTSRFDPGSQFTGAGTTVVGPHGLHDTPDTAVLSGLISTSNLTVGHGGYLSGTTTINGTLDWIGGQLEGTVLIPVGDTLNISTDDTKYFNGGTIDNAGTVAWTGTGEILIYADSYINNTGLFDMQSDSSIGPNSGGSGGAFTNSGHVRKSAGSGSSEIDMTFNNTGQVEAQTGTIAFQNGGIFDNGSSFYGAGAVVLGPNNPDNRVVAGTISTTNLVIGHLAVLTGTATMSGTLGWTGGTVGGHLTIPTGSRLNLSTDDTKYMQDLLIDNAGTTTWSEDGTVSLYTDSIFHNTGLFDAQGNGGWGPHTSGVTGTIINSGTFKKSAGGARSDFQADFNNSGAVLSFSGILGLDNIYTQTAGGLDLEGGNIAGANSSTPFTLQGGILTGAGVLTGTVTNNTLLSPGNGSPIGQITIDGSYTQLANGRLDIHLSGTTPGTGYSQLVVTGNAAIAGALSVGLVGGFQPQNGDTFVVLPAAAVSGTFGSITGAPAGLVAVYNPDNVTLGYVNFSDVSSSDYFYTPVQYLAARGIISGYNDGTFRPYANTTRGQMLKIVVLGFGVPAYTPPGGDNTFTDVPPTFPFFAVIEAGAHAGFVSGYACGGPNEPCDAQHRPYFRPYANVTRGQLSKIVVGAAGWTVLDPPGGTFEDVPPGSPFYPFVETAVARNIISGYACGGAGEPCDGGHRPYFRQGNNATRGQIAKIVYLAILSGP